MRTLYVSVVACGIALSGAALAQSAPASTAQQGSQANASQLASVQKMKQDLQNAGFSDVNVVAEAFVVQAKTKDGNPIVMTIGPHGMTAFEAINTKSGDASTTGSTGSSASSAAASPHK